MKKYRLFAPKKKDNVSFGLTVSQLSAFFIHSFSVFGELEAFSYSTLSYVHLLDDPKWILIA